MVFSFLVFSVINYIVLAKSQCYKETKGEAESGKKVIIGCN